MKIYPLVFLLFAISFSDKAYAVGFFVRPTNVVVSANRGETISINLEVLNKTDSVAQTVLFNQGILTQGLDGKLAVHSPTTAPPSTSDRFTLPRNWISPSASRIKIAPMEKANIPINITIPKNASGTYLGCLVLSNDPSETSGVRVQLNFVIRFEITVSGTTSRMSLSALRNRLSSRKNADLNQTTEFAEVEIENSGNTSVSISGTVSLFQRENQEWRRKITLPIDELKAYPGSSFWLGTELPRRLPTGTYKLDFDLKGDGRNIPTHSHDIEFIGDASISQLAADAELSLPSTLEMVESGPRGRRNLRVEVSNQGDEELHVSALVKPLRALQGVSIGDRLGVDINKPAWFSIRKPEFKLRPNSKRPILLSVNCPDSNLNEAVYYSQIDISATYPDGAKAGQVSSTLAVKISNQVPKYDIRPVDIQLYDVDKNKARIVVTAANVGNIHLIAQARLFISNVTATKTLIDSSLDGPESWVLPFGTPDFSGSIDLTKLPPDTYKLTCQVTFEGGSHSIERMIRVTDIGGVRSSALLKKDNK